MTRGKWVALAVGLAAIAVLVLYGPALWRAVAYDQGRDWGVQVDHEVQPQCVVFMVKRFSWLPGPDFMQWCASCVESRHVNCPRKMGIYQNWKRPGKPLAPVYSAYSCDCPHPSHAQDSE